MNGLERHPVDLQVVDLPVDEGAAWRHPPSTQGEGHALGPHDPGPGDAGLEWVLGLQRGDDVVAVVWLRRSPEGGPPNLGVASASIPPGDHPALVHLLAAGMNRAAESSTGYVSVRLPLERSATLQLLQEIGFTLRSLLVFGGVADVELDLPPRTSPG